MDFFLPLIKEGVPKEGFPGECLIQAICERLQATLNTCSPDKDWEVRTDDTIMSANFLLETKELEFSRFSPEIILTTNTKRIHILLHSINPSLTYTEIGLHMLEEHGQTAHRYELSLIERVGVWPNRYSREIADICSLLTKALHISLGLQKV